MKLRVLLSAAAAAVSVAASAATWAVPASADETGVAVIHTWVKVGKKTCMLDHYHYGSGTGATKKVAQAAAIKDWEGFTAFEYGTSWGNFRIANKKSEKCTGTDKAKDWKCDVEALACRPF